MNPLIPLALSILAFALALLLMRWQAQSRRGQTRTLPAVPSSRVELFHATTSLALGKHMVHELLCWQAYETSLYSTLTTAILWAERLKQEPSLAAYNFIVLRLTVPRQALKELSVSHDQTPHVTIDSDGIYTADRTAALVLSPQTEIDLAWSLDDHAAVDQSLAEFNGMAKQYRNDRDRRRLAREVVADELRRIDEKRARGEPITEEDEARLTQYLEDAMHQY